MHSAWSSPSVRTPDSSGSQEPPRDITVNMNLSVLFKVFDLLVQLSHNPSESLPCRPRFNKVYMVNLQVTGLMKIRFICNQNRSKTAEELFRDRFETKSAGLYNERPVTEKQLQWADAVVVMEKKQLHELSKRFPRMYMRKRILSLDIPDAYHYNQPELIELLEGKITENLTTLATR